MPEPADGGRHHGRRRGRPLGGGQSLLFDDGYEHHAWNDTDGVRVVLFVDVVRPLRPPADQLNRALIKAIGRSPYIRDARNRHEAWERASRPCAPMAAPPGDVSRGEPS